MAEQPIARTIIFDLVQLEKLAADLERRFRVNPTVRVIDVLADVDPDDRVLYEPQLNQLLAELAQRNDAGTLAPLDPAINQTLEVGDDLRRSLMATAMIDSSQPSGSTPGSSKASAGSRGSSSSDSGMPERIDQFRILRELGAGAFGVVYLAEDEQLQRKVAIKVPKVSDPKRCASYINEARKAAAIDCIGIVPIYHVGSKENGIPFVVQKLIDGPSLRLLLDRYGSLPPAHAVTLMRDIAVALGAAHRLGIYHRDLKPDNVLIDTSGVPWIADFGLAISESEQAQKKGEIAGTLLYMSPEQIQGRADWLDGRSDIWALGIMLYELLLGKPPFSGKNRSSLMEQICHREPRPLQQSSVELTPLNDVFQKCCAKSPSERYGSVEELCEDLTYLINEGLPTQPIDGSDLHFEQPISQYPSGNSGGGSRSRVPGSGLTPLSSRGLSTRGAGGSGTHIGSQSGSGSRLSGSHLSGSGSQRFAGNLSASGQSLAPSSHETFVAPKTEHRTRQVMIAVGILSILAVGGQQWYSRRSSANAAGESGGIPTVPAVVVAVTDVPRVDPALLPPVEPPKPLNAMGIELANGTQQLPWVVATDGSGSHRTINEALAASEAGAYVSLKPGAYDESLDLLQPITLIGLGEPDDCVISNAEAAVIKVACTLGSVRVSNVAIRGNANQSRKELNGIEVVSGKLIMDNCHLRSTSQNAIKVKAGSSLDVSRCKFLESSQFAVSAKDAVSVVINDCEFFPMGVQVVGGSVTVVNTTFNGPDGLEVQQSGDTPSVVTGCKFIGCSFNAGIIASPSAKVTVQKSQFERCRIGVTIGDSEVEMRQCTFVKCTSAAVNLDGGKATIAADSSIDGGGNFGCMVIGGTLELLDSRLLHSGDSGIVSKGNSQVRLRQANIGECGGYGIHMLEGELTIEGGSIDGCEQGGIFLSEKFTRATIQGTKFIDNQGAGAFYMEAGELNCTDVEISGGEYGVYAIREDAVPIQITMTRPTFADIKSVVAELQGAINLVIKQGDFGDIPEQRYYKTVGAAKVSVEL